LSDRAGLRGLLLVMLSLPAACAPPSADGAATPTSSSAAGGEGASAGASVVGYGGAPAHGSGGATGGRAPDGGAGTLPDGNGGSGASGAATTCDPAGPRWASEVRSVSYGPGAGFGQDAMPDVVLGPPRGAGCCAGSLDVVALGDGGAIELGFGGAGIADGPGIDFVVFENPFWVGGDPATVFAEPATVEVSEDGSSWHAYACTATEAPWGGCAGWHPVLLDGGLETLDPTSSGGDGFDLAAVGLERARFVRVTDRADVGGLAGIFDLDAVGIVHVWCP
jgi:hypothetical protein